MSNEINAIDFCSANKEFKEFIKFIKTAPDSIREDLSNCLYPFFVYIYMIFLERNEVLEGQRFLSSYLPLFLKAPGYGTVVKTLQEFKHTKEFQDHEYFKQFCESKYNIEFSEEGVSHLKSFFEETESKILLYIFRLHIYIRRNGIQTFPATELWNRNYTNKNFVHSPESQILSFKSAVKLLNQAKKDNISKPLNYTYKIMPGSKNMCSINVNTNNTQLACGFESSDIHLWDLTSNFSRAEKKDNGTCFVKVDVTEMKDFLTCDVIAEKVSNAGSYILLRGHSGAVLGLETSADDQFLLSCSEDGTARVWQRSNAKAISVYSGHDRPIWDIAASPDCLYFATASNDARLWTYEDPFPQRIFLGHTGNIDCITFHPNSKYIATASMDRTIKMWTNKDARDVRAFCGHLCPASSLAFSPNGKHLVSADTSGLIKIWDLSSGRELKEFRPHYAPIKCVSYNRTGTLLATGSFDNFLKVWDAGLLISNESPISDRYDEEFLVDSHYVGAPLKFVKFCKKGLLVSVSCSLNEDL